jgi:hypothetical protein
MSDRENEERTEINWAKSANGVFEVYGNLTHLVWSLDDVRIRIAQMVVSPETPNPGKDLIAIAEEKAAVTLSWRLAKVLHNNLGKAVAAYENVNGEIQLEVTLPKSLPETT